MNIKILLGTMSLICFGLNLKASCSDLVISGLDHSIREVQINQINELLSLGINSQDSKGRTPLYLAIQYNQINKVKELLLTENIDINKADNEGITPLALAVDENNLEIVNALLNYCDKEKNKSVGINEQDERIGFTPLMRAAKIGNDEIIKALLDAKANIYLKSNTNKDASELISKDSTNSLKLLRALKFMDCLSCYDFNQASKLLTLGIDVNAKDDVGLSPIYHAIRKSKEDMVQTLINEKANVNDVQGLSGYTPLHCAAQYGCKEIVEILIKAKADIHAKKLSGHTPLYWADRELVEVLIKAGADVNPKNNGDYSELHWLAKKGDKEIVDILRKAGEK